MGIYYRTCFYRNLHTREGEVVLATLNPIIDNNDIKRGYVLRSELLEFYGPNSQCNLIKEEDIIDGCGLIQYHWCSLDENTRLVVDVEMLVK